MMLKHTGTVTLETARLLLWPFTAADVLECLGDWAG